MSAMISVKERLGVQLKKRYLPRRLRLGKYQIHGTKSPRIPDIKRSVHLRQLAALPRVSLPVVMEQDGYDDHVEDRRSDESAEYHHRHRRLDLVPRPARGQCQG